MGSKQKLMQELSRLRQKRFYAERECVSIGKMIPACLIIRGRTKGSRGLQSMEKIDKNVEHSTYAYLMYHAKGKNHSKYIRKERVKEVEVLTDNYRKYYQAMAEVRELNKNITEVLDKICKTQEVMIKEYE